MKPGIYTSWPECATHVVVFEGSFYKSYKTEEEAVAEFATYFGMINNNNRGEIVRRDDGLGESSKKGNRFYADFRGCSMGIYDRQEDSALQVNGYSGDVYKYFKTKEEGVEEFKSDCEMNTSDQSSSTSPIFGVSKT